MDANGAAVYVYANAARHGFRCEFFDREDSNRNPLPAGPAPFRLLDPSFDGDGTNFSGKLWRPDEFGPKFGGGKTKCDTPERGSERKSRDHISRQKSHGECRDKRRDNRRGRRFSWERKIKTDADAKANGNP
ncbi:hypothetical protein MnTg02_01491 [bacterium MnTg02]|nr:hypothetical protein MnTg02_01491 [bacterium MnTg02]